jgi:hypothetical protein
MEPTFVALAERSLERLRREVLDRRTPGRVYVEFRRLVAPPGASTTAIASAFVQSLSLRPPKAWTGLTERDALEAATNALHRDLVYKSAVMPVEEARELARRFLAGCGSEAAFVTNGSLALTGTGEWSSLTNANFDTGLVGVSSSLVGILWVEDED